MIQYMKSKCKIDYIWIKLFYLQKCNVIFWRMTTFQKKFKFLMHLLMFLKNNGYNFFLCTSPIITHLDHSFIAVMLDGEKKMNMIQIEFLALTSDKLQSFSSQNRNWHYTQKGVITLKHQLLYLALKVNNIRT